MNWLITGGAGYIGSHVIRETIQSGRCATVLDDLSTGSADRIPADVEFQNLSLADLPGLRSVFSSYKFDGVLHLAAKKKVNESIERPTYYWDENVGGLSNLLQTMAEFNVSNFVFSSSAAVYGEPKLGADELITEVTPCNPINPYGATKLVGEWYAHARAISNGFSVAALRYFNVAGAGSKELGDSFVYNLIPLILETLDNKGQPKIYGNDYLTPDGTCIRDYIHVQDLAEAHVAAMDLVESRSHGFEALNIGTGSGSSVLEVITIVSEVTGIELKPEIVSRRIGDPAKSVADVARARELLGWSSKYDLHDIVSSAWNAWQFAKN